MTRVVDYFAGAGDGRMRSSTTRGVGATVDAHTFEPSTAGGTEKLEVVKAYACGQCDRVYLAASEARPCCRCANCGLKFHRASYSSTCGGCRYGAELREARARVRRVEVDLKSARENLKRLVDQGNPGKGSP